MMDSSTECGNSSSRLCAFAQRECPHGRPASGPPDNLLVHQAIMLVRLSTASAEDELPQVGHQDQAGPHLKPRLLHALPPGQAGDDGVHRLPDTPLQPRQLPLHAEPASLLYGRC